MPECMSLSNEFVPEGDVSLVSISLLLEQAFLSHVVQNEEKIYVHASEIFPHWIVLYPDIRMIQFRTYVEFRPEVEESTKLQFCNQVNARLVAPSVYAREERLWINHSMFYSEGIHKSHLLRMVRFLSSGVLQVQNDFDPERGLLLPV